jgi:hypothetical protein
MKVTLEEAAERTYPINNTGSMFMPTTHESNNNFKQKGFIAGAKSDAAKEYWFEKFQQEQNKKMYSEEEVLEHLNHLIMMPSSKLDEFTNDEEMVTMKWFEQF